MNVERPVLSRLADGRARVAVKIAGDELYIAAPGELATNADPWTTALLLPAAKQGTTLRVDAELDRRLHASLPRIQAIARGYWGYPGAAVEARALATHRPAQGRAMFFSGGLDSFYTLFRRRGELDRLIYVHGFDVPLDDGARFARVRGWVEDVAREVGVPAVFAETNLRQHRAFRLAPWEATHGAALATVAHALAPLAARVFIASSDTAAPWGSRPHLDPLWSSDAVDIVSDGEPRKVDKVAAIADWPLVHRYLRVCWANTTETPNCGVCSKCVRAQVMFHIHGQREKLRTFPQTPLVELIDRLPPRVGKDRAIWTELIERLEDPAIIDAIGRFVRRRPNLVERVAHRTEWMRASATGRLVRRAGKRLFVRG